VPQILVDTILIEHSLFLDILHLVELLFKQEINLHIHLLHLEHLDYQLHTLLTHQFLLLVAVAMVQAVRVRAQVAVAEVLDRLDRQHLMEQFLVVHQ
jgi:hypothetical protein